jgi:hypothetical protein
MKKDARKWNPKKYYLFLLGYRTKKRMLCPQEGDRKAYFLGLSLIIYKKRNRAWKTGEQGWYSL